MHSAIYEGWVSHQRFEPIAHRFRYPLFMVYLDLAELDHVFDGNPFWAVGRLNIATFRRSDHLGDPTVPLDKAMRDLVAKHTGRRPSGPIRVLTHLRYFGICFNPVSFYFCFDPAGTRVEATIAEVHNTPWLERHCYVLDSSFDVGNRGEHRFRLAKEFHVSPFMGMDMAYDWRLTEPGEQLRVRITNYREQNKVFEASMVLGRRALSPSALNRVLLRYPFMTLKVILAIYWQALKLHCKGARFYPHPGRRNHA